MLISAEWAVSDLDRISEPIILNFRMQIGYGVYQKISDPIRLQNFHIHTVQRWPSIWSAGVDSGRILFFSVGPGVKRPLRNF